jgi:integral membrane protein
VNLTFLRQLRLVGVIEGVSTLVLFGVAMPLKYLAGVPLAVSIVGPIHGVLFLLLAAMAGIAVDRVPIGRRLGIAAIVAAIFPFGPFVVDRWLAPIAEQAGALERPAGT